MGTTLDTAWLLHQFIVPELGLRDLNNLEEAIPHLLGPSCRKEKERKKRLQVVKFVDALKCEIKVYYTHRNLMRMCRGMAGLRYVN